MSESIFSPERAVVTDANATNASEPMATTPEHSDEIYKHSDETHEHSDTPGRREKTKTNGSGKSRRVTRAERAGSSLSQRKLIERQSKSNKANVYFPVSRIKRYLKNRIAGKRISDYSAIYLAAVLEYLVAEVLEVSGNVTKYMNKKIITPRHIKYAVAQDEELDELLQHVTIPQGGVLQLNHEVLLPK